MKLYYYVLFFLIFINSKSFSQNEKNIKCKVIEFYNFCLIKVTNSRNFETAIVDEKSFSIKDVTFSIEISLMDLYTMLY